MKLKIKQSFIRVAKKTRQYYSIGEPNVVGLI